MQRISSQTIRLLLKKNLREWSEENGHNYSNVRSVLNRWVNNYPQRNETTPSADALKILLDISADTGICVSPALKPLFLKRATGA